MKHNVHFLEGERVLLRPVVASDVTEEYCTWLNDSEVNQFLETRFVPQSLEEIRRYVDQKSGKTDEIFFAICLKDNGRHIGNVKIGPINWLHGAADISLFIGVKEFWGRGYAAEVIRMVTEYSFDRLNLHKVTAGCYDNNQGSAKAFLKAGFAIEGKLRKHLFFNGGYVDKVCLGCLRSDYPQRSCEER